MIATVVALVMLAAACSAENSAETASGQSTVIEPATSTTSLETPPTTIEATTTNRPFDPGHIEGFAAIDVTLGDEPLVVALADTSELRSRGLMGVSDFGDFDGMLFSWGGVLVSGRFWMRDTLVPLTIAFFDADGEFVDTLQMVPCVELVCERYAANGLYAFALELPADRQVEVGTRLVLQRAP